MYLNAYRTGLVDPNPKGNVLLQVNRGLPQPLYAGNVGIGTATPDIKLQVENGSNISANAGGFLQIGNSTSANIAADENQIQARNNGVGSTLYLQTVEYPVPANSWRKPASGWQQCFDCKQWLPGI